VIYLIDASVYVFRAYYSMPPEMADRDGNPAHAVFGFARFLGDLIERAQPRYIAVAFDESLTTSFRNQIYPAYKANREAPPADLKLQFDRCREFCLHAGIPAFAHAEYEADDIVGSLMAVCRAQGLCATLVTRDKDFAQLIRAGDVYWDYTDNARYRYEQIEARFGVAPERFADFLALMGDSVDNIRGVPGVGAKTAAALMREFASLEERPGCSSIATRHSWRAGSPRSPATCRCRSRIPSSCGGLPTSRRSRISSTATISVRCCGARPSGSRRCRTPPRPDRPQSRLLLGTVTRPPMDSWPMVPELSSLTVKSPLTRPA
jgi:hypothetical protein